MSRVDVKKALLGSIGPLLMILLCSCNSQNWSRSTPVVTPTTYRTPLGAINYPADVTDGALKLSVQEVRPGCHKPGDPLTLRFTLTNLTRQPIPVVSESKLAHNRKFEGGNINTIITTEEGRDLYTMGDYMVEEYFDLPTPGELEIPAQRSLDFSLDFYFPPFFVVYPSIEYDPLDFPTPAPGTYIVHFVYTGYVPRPESWQGFVSSNNLKVCIAL